ncbi:hypothetical protein FRC09_014059 [Ceratobasidium sp. 395]|nr:hypothetical protein FRC09_014059 [Ceratobasidium sp. 395]
MAELPQLDSSRQLDESLYSLTPDELSFHQGWTGITDEAELKQHIISVQSRAYKIFPYPCIRRFSFTKLLTQRHPTYKHVLEYVQEHPDAIYLELGCCFGNTARKLTTDGYPAQNIVATDLHQGILPFISSIVTLVTYLSKIQPAEFWKLGFELFRDDASKFPASFVAGDILSSEMLNPSAKKLDERPNLSTIKNLTELLGYVSIIHASAFFHLFSEEDQLKVACGCVTLLTGLPGATIFGAHIGANKPGLYERPRAGNPMFCHSPESWEEMWREALRTTGRNTDIRVWAKVIDMGDDPLFSGGKGYMVWGVGLV